MKKVSKGFFADNEVLFVGYSSRDERFCSDAMQAMMNAGIKVVPFNKKSGGSDQVKVFSSFESLSQVPRCAYVLLNPENARKSVKELYEHGVRKVLFHSKRTATPEVLQECDKLGMEAAVGCPMMLFGSGIHRFHGFLAGIKR